MTLLVHRTFYRWPSAHREKIQYQLVSNHCRPETWPQLASSNSQRVPTDTTLEQPLTAHGGAARRKVVRALYHSLICFRTETISIATIAASAPLLPDLVPARSIACSTSSTVKTPNAQGTPVSSCTLLRPDADSPAT